MHKNLVSANTEREENNTTYCLLEYCISELLTGKPLHFLSTTKGGRGGGGKSHSAAV